MRRHRDDEQHQHRGTGQWLIGDPIEDRPERHHQAEHDQHLQPERQFQRRRPPGDRRHGQRQHQIQERNPRQAPPGPFAHRDHRVEQRRDQAADHQHIDRAGQAAGLQQRQRQRRIGNEFALRHENHAGDGEHQQQRQRQQGVDGAIGDAVLAEPERDVKGHGSATHSGMVSVRRSGRAGMRNRR